MLEDICRQAEQAAEELIEKAKLHPGQIVVIGCSTSEICGSRIGSDSRRSPSRSLPSCTACSWPTACIWPRSAANT